MKNPSEIRAEKLARIRRGAAPRVLELCSGCGGLSLGLKAAGFDLVAHVEADETAAATYAMNFRSGAEAPQSAWETARDMTKSDSAALCQDLGLHGDVVDQFDVLAAGLPCQAFARIGRSKLRSITGDDEAFKNDPRARLYHLFLQYVRAVQPAAILIENVPDILNFGGHNVPEEIASTLEELGYNAGYSLLNAAYYGVPQMRERLFLIAIDSSLGVMPGFPDPTHMAKLPSGYGSARSSALSSVPKSGSRFVEIPVASEGMPRAVTVREALSDLPRITEHFKDPVTMRRRKPTEELSYSSFSFLSGYATRMRNWPGVGKTYSGTDGHVVRLTPRDFEIFRRMRHGDDYPHALAVAQSILDEKLQTLSPQPVPGSVAYDTLKKAVVPPYDPGKFPNKWWKLDPSMLSRTLTAHMGKDTYSHIHWDSGQKRTISVREAARLQSFPDAFKFSGSMNAAFRQIGNAVPPLLAKAVASRLKQDLMRATTLKEQVSPRSMTRAA